MRQFIVGLVSMTAFAVALPWSAWGAGATPGQADQLIVNVANSFGSVTRVLVSQMTTLVAAKDVLGDTIMGQGLPDTERVAVGVLQGQFRLLTPATIPTTQLSTCLVVARASDGEMLMVRIPAPGFGTALGSLTPTQTPTITPTATFTATSACPVVTPYSIIDPAAWADKNGTLNASGVAPTGSREDVPFAVTAPLNFVWSYSNWAGGTPPNANPVIRQASASAAGGLVYTTANSGQFMAWNATTGALAWSYVTGADNHCTPAIANGLFYADAAPGVFYALNAATGGLVWTYNLQFDRTIANPAVADGVAYIAVADSKTLFAFNSSTGTLNWSYVMAGNPNESTVSIGAGRVYVADSAGKVYALNHTGAGAGALNWSYQTATGIAGASPRYHSGRLYAEDTAGDIYSLNAQTGSLIWSSVTGLSMAETGPAIAGCSLYTGAGNNLLALNAGTGQILWSYNVGAAVYSTPAVGDGFVYYGSADNRVLANDATTGAVAWSFLLPTNNSGGDAQGVGRCSPALALTDHLFITSENGNGIFVFTRP